MHRRRVLSLVGVAAASAVAGCSTATAPSGDNSDGRETENDDGVLDERGAPPTDVLASKPRPPADQPVGANEETVPALQYPAKLASYSTQSVHSYVADYERAYRRNEVLGKYGGDLVANYFDVDWTVALDAGDEAGVGRCQYRYTTTERSGSDDAGPVVGDSPTYVVTYYVDDSMVVRVEGTGPTENQEELSPDPWESGVVLEPAD